jgi:hypothetical protein
MINVHNIPLTQPNAIGDLQSLSSAIGVIDAENNETEIADGYEEEKTFTSLH